MRSRFFFFDLAATYRYLCIFCLFLFVSPFFLFSQETSEEIRITSDEFENISDELTIFHRASFSYLNFSIQADKVLLNTRSRKLTLKNDISLSTDEYVILSDFLELDFDSESFYTSGSSVYLKKTDVYIQVGDLRFKKDQITLKDISLTQCNPQNPDWEITIDTLYVKRDNFVAGVNNIFYFYGIPLFYSPFLSGIIRQERHSGFLTPSLNYRTSGDAARVYGIRLRIPYFINLGLDHDLTVTPDIFSERGIGAKLDYNYAFVEGMKGRAQFWGLSESFQDRTPETEERMQEDDNPNPERFTFNFDHKQRFVFNPSFSTLFFLNAERNSDNEVNEDYRSNSEEFELEHFVSLSGLLRFYDAYFSTYIEDKTKFTLQSRYDLSNDSDTILMEQPNFYFLWNQDFWDPVNVNFHSDISQFKRRKSGWTGNRMLSGVEFALPFHFLGLRFLPSLEFNLNTYETRYISPDPLASDFENQRSFADFYLKKKLIIDKEFYRLFENDQGASNYRLAVTPRLIYKESDDFDQRDSLLLRPGDAPLTGNREDYENHATLFDEQDLVYGYRSLELQLEFELRKKRAKNPGAFTYLNFKIRQIYDLNELLDEQERAKQGPQIEDELRQNPDGEPTLPLILESKLTPDDFFTLDSFLRYSSEDSNLIEQRHSLTYKNEYNNSLTFSYVNNLESYRELNGEPHYRAFQAGFSADYYPTDRLKTFASMSWDFEREETATNGNLPDKLTGYTIGFLKDNCCYQWGISYGETIKSGTIDGAEKEFLESELVFTFSIFETPLNYETRFRK